MYEAINNENNLASILNLISEKVENYYIRMSIVLFIFMMNTMKLNLSVRILPSRTINQLDLLTITANSNFNPNAVYIKDFTANTQKQVELNKYSKINGITGSWTKPILTPQNEILGVLTLFNQDDIELKQIDINYLNRLALLIQLAIKYAEQKSN